MVDPRKAILSILQSWREAMQSFTSSTPKWFQTAGGIILLIAACVALVGGIRHAWFAGNASQEIWAGVCYLLVSGVLVLLPNTAKLSLGRDGLVLEQKVEQLQQQLDTTAGAIKGLSTKTNTIVSATNKLNFEIPSVESQLPRGYLHLLQENGIPVGTDIEDPLKTASHPSQSDRYRLTASVTRDSEQKNWFKTIIKVTAIDSHVNGSARFFLHPTFPHPVLEERLVRGVAQTAVWSYGSFTVVVKIDDGTLLELDIAEISGVPQEFKDN